MPPTSHKKRAIVWGSFLFLGLLAWSWIVLFLSAPEESIYARIKRGMDRSEVHKVLGNPDRSIVTPTWGLVDAWDNQSVLVRYQDDKVYRVIVTAPENLRDRLENIVVIRKGLR